MGNVKQIEGGDLKDGEAAFLMLDESMKPHLLPGHTAIIKTGGKVIDFQMGVIRAGAEYFLARVYHEKGGFILTFDNRYFSRVRIRTAETKTAIIGPVTGWKG
jgi:phage repressor protein C with HTH and peptisase S24 domain